MEARSPKFNEAPPTTEHRSRFNKLLLKELNLQKIALNKLRELLPDIPATSKVLIHKFVCQKRLYISELVTIFKTNNHDVQAFWPKGLVDPYTVATGSEIQQLTSEKLGMPTEKSKDSANKEGVVPKPSNSLPKRFHSIEAIMLSSTNRIKVAKDKVWADIRENVFSVEHQPATTTLQPQLEAAHGETTQAGVEILALVDMTIDEAFRSAS
eukprot:GILK01021735.1.p1 GENE.GILK01021735.1~~GILK01021735.1.p1  ORF type:complete len:230 (+),score=16.44 GILK01021735.1:58-690(+)